MFEHLIVVHTFTWAGTNKLQTPQSFFGVLAEEHSILFLVILYSFMFWSVLANIELHSITFDNGMRLLSLTMVAKFICISVMYQFTLLSKNLFLTTFSSTTRIFILYKCRSRLLENLAGNIHLLLPFHPAIPHDDIPAGSIMQVILHISSPMAE